MQLFSFKNQLLQKLKAFYKRKILGLHLKLLWGPSEQAPKPPCSIFQFPNSSVTATAEFLDYILGCKTQKF